MLRFRCFLTFKVYLGLAWMLIYNSVLHKRRYPDLLDGWNSLTFSEFWDQNVKYFVNSFNVSGYFQNNTGWDVYRAIFFNCFSKIVSLNPKDVLRKRNEWVTLCFLESIINYVSNSKYENNRFIKATTINFSGPLFSAITPWPRI